MGNLFIYAIMVTLMSYAILEAYFSGRVFITIRTYFDDLKERSEETHSHLGYFIGYLFTCYFCASYWVSWLVAFGTYKIVFVEPMDAFSAALVIFGTGLFSVTLLDMFNSLVIKEADEYGAFFPWNNEEEDDEPDKEPTVPDEPDKEPDISDSVEDTIDNPVVDTDSPTEISKENE